MRVEGWTWVGGEGREEVEGVLLKGRDGQEQVEVVRRTREEEATRARKDG